MSPEHPGSDGESITIHRQRTQEGLRFKFRLTNTLRFVLGICIDGEVDFRGFSPPAGGVNKRQFSGDLDAAAAFGVEAGVENVGADVLVVVADEGEVGLASVEGA